MLVYGIVQNWRSTDFETFLCSMRFNRCSFVWLLSIRYKRIKNVFNTHEIDSSVTQPSAQFFNSMNTHKNYCNFKLLNIIVIKQILINYLIPVWHFSRPAPSQDSFNRPTISNVTKLKRRCKIYDPISSNWWTSRRSDQTDYSIRLSISNRPPTVVRPTFNNQETRNTFHLDIFIKILLQLIMSDVK